MNLSLYNFDLIQRTSENESYGQTFAVTDYWQYYTTGVERLITDKEFFLSKREINERSEVLAWKYYDNPSVSDVIVASNNDNYLFDAPFENEMKEKILDSKLNYVKKLYKNSMSMDLEQYFKDKLEYDVDKLNDIQRNVVLPKQNFASPMLRKMKTYFQMRQVH
jgi:hypothetical protein